MIRGITVLCFAMAALMALTVFSIRYFTYFVRKLTISYQSKAAPTDPDKSAGEPELDVEADSHELKRVSRQAS